MWGVQGSWGEGFSPKPGDTVDTKKLCITLGTVYLGSYGTAVYILRSCRSFGINKRGWFRV